MPVTQIDPNTDYTRDGVDFRLVVLQLRDDLVRFVGLPDVRVVIVSDRKYNPRALAETHIRVRPLGRKVEPNPGGGKLAALRTQIIAIDTIVRVAADDAASDEQAMTHPQTGVLALQDKVVSTLNLHSPTRADRRLLVQPLAEVNADDPNRPSPGEGFSSETAYFEARYFPSQNLRWP